jgi:16S rRNA processing protein RimM
MVLMGGPMANYCRLAQITRVKGLAGELVAAPLRALPLRVWENLRLWIVPPDHDLIRETRVCSVAEHGARGADLLLTLEGVTDRLTAQRLQGRFVLACVDDCGEALDEVSNGGSGEAGSAVGLTVVDEERGLLGTIVEERRSTAQTLWVLDGPFGEVLVPAVEEFILSRDAEAICVHLPHGLLELNR